MYEVNGIDLTGTEKDVLCSLVGARDLENISEYIERDLYQGDRIFHPFPDEEKSKIYLSLHKKGLVDGHIRIGSFCCPSDLTYQGIDGVRDFKAKEKAEREMLWSNRAFQIGLSIVTFVLSAFLGWVAGHF